MDILVFLLIAFFPIFLTIRKQNTNKGGVFYTLIIQIVCVALQLY